MLKPKELLLLEHQIQMDEAEIKLRSLKSKRWLRRNEVALYLGSTPEAIKKLYQRGRLQANKAWGRLYFDREMLDRLIENSPAYGTAAIPVKDGPLRRSYRWQSKK